MKLSFILLICAMAIGSNAQSFNDLLKVCVMWKDQARNIDSIEHNFKAWGYVLKEETIFTKNVAYVKQTSAGSDAILLAVKDGGNVSLTIITHKPEVINEYYKQVSRSFPLVDGNYLKKSKNGDYTLIVFGEEPKYSTDKTHMYLEVKRGG